MRTLDSNPYRPGMKGADLRTASSSGSNTWTANQVVASARDQRCPASSRIMPVCDAAWDVAEAGVCENWSGLSRGRSSVRRGCGPLLQLRDRLEDFAEVWSKFPEVLYLVLRRNLSSALATRSTSRFASASSDLFSATWI